MNNEIRELLKELIEESMGFDEELMNEKEEIEIKNELLKEYEERLNGILKGEKMKKYYEIECDDGDLDEEDVEEALGEWWGTDFKVREIPKNNILAHGLNLCDCNKKVIADGNKGMEMGEI